MQFNHVATYYHHSWPEYPVLCIASAAHVTQDAVMAQTYQGSLLV